MPLLVTLPIDAVTAALDLAHQGRPAEGYALLLEGCQRAQEAAAGKEWEAVLLDRWRGALERYGERWPVGRARSMTGPPT